MASPAAAGRIRKGSTGARKRGVSTLTSTTLSASRSGTHHTQPGDWRASRVKAPARIRSHTTQKPATPMPAVRVAMLSAAADACQANEPSSSNMRRALWYATLKGAVGWSAM